MKRVLFIGDAHCASGFARSTHKVCDALHAAGWDVHVLGLNYTGDPHPYPYRLYPAAPGVSRGDFAGVQRTKALVEQIRPDVVVIQNDTWNVPGYMKEINKVEPRPKVVGFLAVDGKNVQSRFLKGLDKAIFWTRFAELEALEAGFTFPTAVVPLGVDLDVYKPSDRRVAREQLFMTPDGPMETLHDVPLQSAFIVGNINRNQPRKHLDLQISYFADFVKQYDATNAFLYFHACPTGDLAYDIQQLMKYYGLNKRLIYASPEIGHGIPEAGVVATMNCFDVMMTTSTHEGMGLPTLEGMACRIPQILPDHSAFSDWAVKGAMMVKCSEIEVTPNGCNMIGGIMDRTDGVVALGSLYKMPELREAVAVSGFKVANDPRYRWENIGAQFVAEMETL